MKRRYISYEYYKKEHISYASNASGTRNTSGASNASGTRNNGSASNASGTRNTSGASNDSGTRNTCYCCHLKCIWSILNRNKFIFIVWQAFKETIFLNMWYGFR